MIKVQCHKVYGKMPVPTDRTLWNRLKYYVFGWFIPKVPLWRDRKEN